MAVEDRRWQSATYLASHPRFFSTVPRRISPAIRQHISATTQIPFNAAGRIRHQVYVAVAVALATFLLAISAVRLICHGYDMPASVAPTVAAKSVAADGHDPPRAPGRKADEQLHSAVEAASTEFADAETAVRRNSCWSISRNLSNLNSFPPTQQRRAAIPAGRFPSTRCHSHRHRGSPSRRR